MYDCDHCCLMGLKKRRVCFRYDGREQGVVLPIIERNQHSGLPEVRGWEKQWIEAEDFFIWMAQLEEVEPYAPLFELIKQKIGYQEKEVCPTGLLFHDRMVYQAILFESFAKHYGVMPFTGGVAEQPNIILEAFETIRATQSEFESWMIVEQQRKAESGQHKIIKSR